MEMSTGQAFWHAFEHVFLNVDTLLIVSLSALGGLIIGGIPGLTATMAVALLVPLTYFMDPVTALASIVTLEACAIFAGDVPNALVRIPGTPSSAAYTDDAYALTKKGLQAKVLGMSLVFSVFGGLFGAVVLMVAAPQLARFALNFTSFEYFWLAVLGLSSAAIVSRGSVFKGAFALLLGVMLSTIGLSDVHSSARFTFGIDPLLDGVHFIPAMIGLFGVSEVFRHVLAGTAFRSESSEGNGAATWEALSRPFHHLARGLKDVYGGTLGMLWQRKWHALRSGSFGTVIGILPGAGADIAAWVAFAISKRFSKKPEEFGSGSLEGITDATTANNAALGGAFVPALVFGIPGDSVTAIVIGVLLMKNIKPGPGIFVEQPELLYSIYLTFIAANLVLLPFGFLAIQTGATLIRIPRHILLPIVLLFSTVGAYAIHNDLFDIWVMLVMGLLGVALEAFGIPIGPVVLGIILGDDVERYFIQSMTKSNGSFAAFFERPVSAALGIACLLTWLTPAFLRIYRHWRKQS